MTVTHYNGNSTVLCSIVFYDFNFQASDFTRELPDFPYDGGFQFVKSPRLGSNCAPFHYVYSKYAPWREEVDGMITAFLEAGLDQKFYSK